MVLSRMRCFDGRRAARRSQMSQVRTQYWEVPASTCGTASARRSMSEMPWLRQLPSICRAGKGEPFLSALLTGGNSRAAARLETAVQIAGDPGVATFSNKTALGLVLRKLAPGT